MGEITVLYSKFANEVMMFKQITDFLDMAQSKTKKISFDPTKIYGKTAVQSFQGMCTTINDSEAVMRELVNNTHTFLDSIGIVFSEVDQNASKEIEK